jgi:hypothetical protein
VANEFERLALVAFPGFLGRLREHLGAPLQSRLAFTLDRDDVAQTAKEIGELQRLDFAAARRRGRRDLIGCRHGACTRSPRQRRQSP